MSLLNSSRALSLVPPPSAVWRALPIMAFGSGLTVLVNSLYQLNAGLELGRFWLATTFWLPLIGSAAVLVLIPRRRWGSWPFLQTWHADWPSAILITGFFIPVFIGFVGA